MQLYCPQCDIEQTMHADSSIAPSCIGCGQALTTKAANELRTRTSDSLLELSETVSLARQGVSHIGRFEVIAHVATGGFGDVFKARDPVLDVPVAIKIPRTDRMTTSQLDDFVAEAQTLAKLEHPNIVPIKEIQRNENGQWFIVMKWVDGQTLSQFARRESLETVQILRIVRAIADALQFAHRQGVYHRDLKPANILIDEDLHPFVSDFGLALHESNQLNCRNQVAGTLPYMSPEQVEGKSHFLDGRSDIWSIGVILYELLTGQRPFVGERSQISEQILEREPKPPRQVNENILPELESITLRCLEKNPKDRFASAAELSEAISRLQQSKPKTSDRSSTIRNLLLASGIGLAAVSIVLWQPWIPESESNLELELESDSPEQVSLLGRWQPEVLSPGQQVTFKNNSVGISSPGGRSMFSFGQTDDGNDEIKFSFDEIGGRGLLGFFWGFDGETFQFLMIDQDDKNQNNITISRHIATFDSNQVYNHAMLAGQVDVDVSKHNGMAHEVLLKLSNKRLREIKLDGARLVDLYQEELAANCMGEFGVFVSDSNTMLSNLTINGVQHAFTPWQQ